MYKIDDDFRPGGGRVFWKATQEHNTPQQAADLIQQPYGNGNNTMHSSSSLKKTKFITSTGTGRDLIPTSTTSTTSISRRGPPITTNLDDKNVRFQHQIKHEKTIEAVITDYPGVAPASAVPHERSTIDRSIVLRKGFHNENGHGALGATSSVVIPVEHSSSSSTYQQVTRNKRTSTEILGSSLESTKLSQRAANGHRRITTHIVRKVTTLSRAEEQQQAESLLPPTKMLRSTELEYRQSVQHPPLQAIEPRRQSKVTYGWLVRGVIRKI